jgi:adenosylcobinamide kinase / adenosylcobinamide-phosphate guanylyltransferase
MRGRRRRASRLILVLGGASSGKSQVALDLAGRARPRAFLATGQALDREMAERISKHRASRPADWTTAEVPVDLARWINDKGHKYQLLVIDCLTLWLSNFRGAKVRDSAVPEKVTELLTSIRRAGVRVVLVSNELGLGLVPATRSVRAFRDLAGRVNQRIATEADEVYFVVSGLPLRVK